MTSSERWPDGIGSAPEPAADEAVLRVVQTQMAARLARRGAAPPSLLRGYVDVLRRGRVEGWAFDDCRPGAPITLAIVLDGIEIGQVTASCFREDLQQAGIGSGHHAFSFALPSLALAARHLVAVRQASDGQDLNGSPGVIEPYPAAEHSQG